ncbi:MAG: ATP-binding protein [Bacillota bacterium]|nr:ATP-binding protein [Bacillota bacterium]
MDRPSVLIIDDDPGICEIIRYALEENNLFIMVKTDVFEAMKWLGQNSPALIILDHKMKEMNATQFIQSVIALKGHMPDFIAITGIRNESLAVTMLKYGAYDYIIKDESFITALESSVKRFFDKYEVVMKLEESEEKLWQNTSQLVLAQKIARIGSWEYNPATNTITWSDEIFSILGLDKEDGLDFKKIYYMINEEDRMNWVYSEENDLIKEYVKDQEFRITCNDGSKKWMLVNQIKLEKPPNNRVALYGTMMDVSDRKQSEERLKESERKYRTIFENAQIGNCRFHRVSGEIVECNLSLANTLGFKNPKQLISNKLSMKNIMEINTFIKIIEEMEKSKDGSTESQEIRVIRNDRKEVYLLYSGKMYPESEIIDCVMADITKSKIIEQELKIALENAARADKLKSEFIANISHEIRTPLSAVIGFSELLTLKLQEEKLKKYVVSINTAGKNLLMLINDILDISKIEAGMMELKPSKTEIRKIFSDIEAIFYETFLMKNVNFQININESIPEFLFLDEIRIRQILFNLVGNAVKFTDKGKVILSAEVEANDGNCCYIKIEVSDTGLGITPEEQKVIFDNFRQKPSQEIDKYGGSGLGLPICKKLSELMGGSIEVQSVINEGSKFAVRIPQVVILSND